MTKRVQLRIFPDGRVQAEVQGIKGKACTSYISSLEELVKAEAVDSSYTPEYFEKEIVHTGISDEQSVANS